MNARITKTLLVLLVLVVSLNDGLSQHTSSELELIETAHFEKRKFDARHPTFMKIGNNAFTRYNPISLTFSGLLYLYQKAISPQLQSHCPYEVSCSAFSKASIQEFGLIKGVALSADRLTRCTQFTLLDISPSQIHPGNGRIIDPLNKYQGRTAHDHDHDHDHEHKHK